MLGTSLGVAAVLLLHADPAPVEEVETPLVRPQPIRFDVGARVEFRSGQPEGVPGTTRTDVEIDPVLALRLPFRQGSLTLSYEPRLFIVVREYPPQEAEKVSYLNRARLVLDTTPGPRWRVYFEGRFAYGEND